MPGPRYSFFGGRQRSASKVDLGTENRPLESILRGEEGVDIDLAQLRFGCLEGALRDQLTRVV